jgi:hypothetical protein
MLSSVVDAAWYFLPHSPFGWLCLAMFAAYVLGQAGAPSREDAAESWHRSDRSSQPWPSDQPSDETTVAP